MSINGPGIYPFAYYDGINSVMSDWASGHVSIHHVASQPMARLVFDSRSQLSSESIGSHVSIVFLAEVRTLKSFHRLQIMGR